MNNKDILYKAIIKAEENGYNSEAGLSLVTLTRNAVKPKTIKGETGLGGSITTMSLDLEYLELNVFIPYIIFSHDFAKAFWGEELLCDGQTKEQIINGYKKEINSDPLDIKMSNKEIERSFIEGKYYFIVPNWEYHLEKMVLCKEPLKYLEKFL